MEHHIITLVYTLFRALDAGDDEAAGNAFSPAGIWHRQGAELKGPSEIAKALGARDPKRRTAHVITNLLIEEAPRGWTARYYLTGYVAQGTDPLRPLAILDCTDEIEMVDRAPRIVLKTSRKLGDLA